MSKATNPVPDATHAGNGHASAPDSKSDVRNTRNHWLPQVIEHLNRACEGNLRLTHEGRIVKVELTCHDAEMQLSALGPVRPQLVAELKRMATLMEYLADAVSDSEYCDSERNEAEVVGEVWKESMSYAILLCQLQ